MTKPQPLARRCPGHARRDYSLAAYQHAIAQRLRTHGTWVVDPAVFQSIWILHESTALFRRALSCPALHRVNVTWTQFEVLLQLWLYGEEKMGDIAAAAAICNATLTDVVAVLTRRGYLTRHTSSRDRRATLLAITPDGAAAVMDIIDSFNDAATDAPAGWKDEDLDAFDRVVQQLLATDGDNVTDVSSQQGVDHQADAAYDRTVPNDFENPVRVRTKMVLQQADW
jgi:DNA-binding MarR family transcriptional regulator